jgi:hypothetical protein
MWVTLHRYRSLICYRYRCEFGWLRLFLTGLDDWGYFVYPESPFY